LYHASESMSEAPTAETGSNQPPVFSVSELSAEVKRTVEGRFDYVRVRGEVSRPNLAGSGHCYLRLKDANAVLDGVIWRGSYQRLGMVPEEGMEVVATGRLTTYAGRSTYQVVIERMELAGEGALLKLIEERRKKLAAEGLFDAERKRPLPYLPAVIGVVTSPTGAVIRDILHRLRDRFPRHVLVWPVLVQGEGAAPQVADAIAGFNALDAGGAVPRPDLLIVARGGGSLEDLMAFNEEAVVRAAAASAIPLISAVGHETDTTLIDHAADVRAPTPTAAAEMAVPVRAELLAQVADDGARLDRAATRELRTLGQHLDGLARGLPRPRAVLEAATQRLDDAGGGLAREWRRYAGDRAAALDALFARLPTPAQQVLRAADRVTAVGRAFDTALGTLLRGAAERGARDSRALDGLATRLGQGWTRDLARREERVRALGRQLEALSYRGALDRGFVLVRDAAGQAVKRAADTAPGMTVALQFADGSAGAVIDGTAAPKPAKRKRHPNGRQGELL